MAEYGELLSGGPEDVVPSTHKTHDEIYGMFCRYFSDPLMYKIKNVHDRSVYMCKLYCLLSRECRYIITIVDVDPFQPLRAIPLKEQRWHCLQTRTLADNHALPQHGYNNRAVGEWSAPIRRIEVTEDACRYVCEDLGLTVELLLNGEIPEKYQPHGTLNSALETFQTVVYIDS